MLESDLIIGSDYNLIKVDSISELGKLDYYFFEFNYPKLYDNNRNIKAYVTKNQTGLITNLRHLYSFSDIDTFTLDAQKTHNLQDYEITFELPIKSDFLYFPLKPFVNMVSEKAKNYLESHSITGIKYELINNTKFKFLDE